MQDFVRHDMDVDVECHCGHKNTLNARWVLQVFTESRWYTGLHDGFSMGNPYTRFYCTVCYGLGRGKQRPKHIGPHYR